MARPSRGNIYKRQLARGWTYYARVNIEVDGVVIRKSVNLKTQSKAVARRKAQQLQRAGASSTGDASAVDEATAVETVAAACERIVEAAKVDGMRTWKSLQARLETDVVPHLGDMPVDKVRPRDVRYVLEQARERGLARLSLVHLRTALSKVFDTLWRDEDISENPVARVKVPSAERDMRQRVHLTQEEWDQLVLYLDSRPDSERVSGMPVRELQMMCVAARCIGGQRTSDMHAWRWEKIDLEKWESCYVTRPKTEKRADRMVSTLVDVKHKLQPGHRRHLQRWHAHEGEPKTGPVFPVRAGKNAGEHKQKTGYSLVLREALRRAFGIVVPRVERVTTTRKYKDGSTRVLNRDRVVWEVARAMTDRERLVLEESEHTLPTDMHSMRRAYCTGLGAAGVNIQTQMALAGHSQPSTAMMYTKLAQSGVDQDVEGIPDAPTPRPRLVG